MTKIVESLVDDFGERHLMNIDIFWDNDEKTIIRFDYKKGWTWEDFSEANTIVQRMNAEVNHTTHIIANFEDGAFPPMGALGKFKTAQENMPEQSVVVVVGGGAFITSLVTMFSRVYKALSRKLMVADSLDDARRKIAAL